MGWMRSLLGRLRPGARQEDLSDSDLRELEARLGYRFRHASLLIHAATLR